MTNFRTLCGELLEELLARPLIVDRDLIDRARAALAAPTEGEVGELVAKLHRLSCQNPLGIADPTITRAADLLEQFAPPAPAVVPVAVTERLPGLVPMEYADLDSGAVIVSVPSDDGPGGCWVVRNSHFVSPFLEFPSPEAAWHELRRAHALPLPSGEVQG